MPHDSRTVRQIHRRLRPGSPFVAAHASFPQEPGARAVWLDRYAAYAVASGVDATQAAQARAADDGNLNMLDPEEDETILRRAGFRDIQLFYTAFTWRGWVARA